VDVCIDRCPGSESIIRRNLRIVFDIPRFTTARSGRMRRVIIAVVSLVCCLAALFGIKRMDLPGLITALLVIIDIGFAMLVLVYAMGGENTEAVRPSGEEKKR
jgi:hypothetical protein